MKQSVNKYRLSLYNSSPVSKLLNANSDINILAFIIQTF